MHRAPLELRKLPADFEIDGQRLPISVGKVSFVRLVRAQSTINILGQQHKVGKRLKFHYVKATLYTVRQTPKVYHRGRLTKVFPYKLAHALASVWVGRFKQTKRDVQAQFELLFDLSGVGGCSRGSCRIRRVRRSGSGGS